MHYNPFSLKDKTVFVTGASSGIGKAIAIECSRMGAKLIISGRDADRLGITFSLLEGNGHKQIIADLKDEDEYRHMIEELPELDGLVHCAGKADNKPFQFVNKENLSDILSVNFTAPVLITAEIIKKKKVKKGASIVFISSISGVRISYVAGASYSATKGAINGIIKGMALDLAGRQIRVNSVCPGMINTDILKEGKITEEQLVEDSKKYPLKRYGNPEEVAYAVVYLLSDASKWVTGSNLVIDGGYTLL